MCPVRLPFYIIYVLLLIPTEVRSLLYFCQSFPVYKNENKINCVYRETYWGGKQNAQNVKTNRLVEIKIYKV